MNVAMIEIPATSAEGEPEFAHLDPIIDALLRHGNKLEGGPRWRMTNAGYHAQLIDPIDLDFVRAKIRLPPTVILKPNVDAIFCSHCWATIQGRDYMEQLYKSRAEKEAEKLRSAGFGWLIGDLRRPKGPE